MKLIFLALAACLTLTAAHGQKNKPAAAASLEKGTTGPDGRRVGKWDFYSRDQTLELTFDYDSSRIAYQRPDTTRFLVHLDEQWQLKRVGRAPHVLGSTDQRLASIQGKLRYPVSALQRQLQGTVLLSYTVAPNGHTRDYKIENSLSPDCDQEVWKAIKDAPDNWIPAVVRGRPTPARFYLAVQFRMEMGDEAGLRRRQRAAQQTAPGAGSPPIAAAQPHYTQELFVTALGIERSVRTEQMGR